MKIDLGSGLQQREGFINIDKRPLPGIDIVTDIELGFPLPSNSINSIRAHHFFEHISDIIKIMDECWRILEKNGVLEITSPRATDPIAAWSDPEHKRALTERSFYYFTPSSYSAFPYTDKLWIIVEEAHNESEFSLRMVPIK